jgi:DNA-binding response OmpR family regulator
MPKKILFIEDESALQKTFGDLLASRGYDMISALDGKAGVELAGTEKLDLILLDLVLPKLHGLDVLKRLKEDEKTKSIPIVILTNLEGIKDVDKALELGATTYLVKAQYTLEEVFEKIKKVLGD